MILARTRVRRASSARRLDTPVGAAALVVIALNVTGARAQPPGLDDAAFERAAMVVTIFDGDAAACPRPPAAAAATIEAWQRTNDVALVRRRFAAVVVLFKNGDALTDVEGLAFPAARGVPPRRHLPRPRRGRHGPVRWRAGGHRVERAPFPAGWTCGALRRGRCAWCGDRCVGRHLRGRARQAGHLPYRRTRDRDDLGHGTAERCILVTGPADPKAAIWLDGIGYPRRRP